MRIMITIKQNIRRILWKHQTYHRCFTYTVTTVTTKCMRVTIIVIQLRIYIWHHQQVMGSIILASPRIANVFCFGSLAMRILIKMLIKILPIFTIAFGFGFLVRFPIRMELFGEKLNSC